MSENKICPDCGKPFSTTSPESLCPRCLMARAIKDQSTDDGSLSHEAQTVTIDDRVFSFEDGETIHTENSYKYSADEFIQLAERAGFVSDKLWIDESELFSVHLFSVKV